MEFAFDVNCLFEGDVCILDNRLLPVKNDTINSTIKMTSRSQTHKAQFMEILDKMGEASAKAQNLHGPITSGRKLEISDHKLYLIKDPNANAIVGILKVGRKRLFVYDHEGKQHEVKPLCVLDFYVHESRQRTGCGKQLFEFMLRSEGVKVAHLAIDRPSHMFSSFLKKHYNLKATINQVNNFVIFQGFFRDRPSESRRSKPPLHPYRKRAECVGSRLSLRSQQKQQQNQIQEKEALQEIPARPVSCHELNPTRSDSRSSNPDIANQLGGLTLTNQRDYGGAKSRNYSRHDISSPVPSLPSVENNTSTSAPSKKLQSAKQVIVDPPLLQRDGPPKEYKILTNTPEPRLIQPSGHTTLLYEKPSSVNDRKIMPSINNKPSSATYGMIPDGITRDFYTAHSAKPQNIETSWTVFGVPPNYRGRTWHHTKLW
ncbi:uncharacterized protein LOC141908612 [Tubulanus polymorphus]|uniref:uncharacterized protein LOC141908612 n=1 Tax=Tubulanus polymorphus TaxID=672921 RepID=UPI003DA404C3